jgi:hypothetical protein
MSEQLNAYADLQSIISFRDFFLKLLEDENQSFI